MIKPVILYETRFADVDFNRDGHRGRLRREEHHRLPHLHCFWKVASAGTKYITVGLRGDKSADSLG